MIKATHSIQVVGLTEFNKRLGNLIVEQQNSGYKVEVAGFTAVGGGKEIVYSALIILR